MINVVLGNCTRALLIYFFCAHLIFCTSEFCQQLALSAVPCPDLARPWTNSLINETGTSSYATLISNCTALSFLCELFDSKFNLDTKHYRIGQKILFLFIFTMSAVGLNYIIFRVNLLNIMTSSLIAK